MKAKMKILILFIFCLGISRAQNDLPKLVNPVIGTGGHGHTYPGAVYPFGMIQPSPDTRTQGWDAASGYHYSDDTILGFSQTHLSGTGVSDYCDLLIMPSAQKPVIGKGYSGYASGFQHKNERAHAGFYEVLLDESKINVQITSDQRTAFYKFSGTEQSDSIYMVINLSHRDELLNYNKQFVDKHTIIGYRISSSWAKEQHFYFQLKTEQPYSIVDSTDDGEKIIIAWPYQKESLVKISMSPVNEENAGMNMKEEVPHWKWSKVYKKNQEAWQKELHRIEYEGTEKEDTLFYTALYHNFIVPNLFQDVNGDYRGTDLKVHNDTSFNYYSVFSLWDTYRASNALYSLLMPARMEDFIQTILQQYKDGGRLPMWELAGNYTKTMIGYHAASIISEAYLKEIRNFDLQLALKAMTQASNRDELGKKAYRQQGYLGITDEHESVSKLFEYGYDDYAIARYASLIGALDTANYYFKRSNSYINNYNPENKFVQPRMNGKFTEFDPTQGGFSYTEANGWQYAFGMPHDIYGYARLLGGQDSLENKLDELFHTPYRAQNSHKDITGLIGQYAHGNEPSHHIPFAYNFTNAPEKTQFYTSKILDEFYTNKPDGLIGNEDCGQMSAWYVFNALGMYPFVPASGYYSLTTPKGDVAKINLENGNTFTIKNRKLGKKNNYIQWMNYNRKSYKLRFLEHRKILNGGTFEFITGDTAKESFKKNRLVFQTVNENIVPVPYFKYDQQFFEDSVKLEIHNSNKRTKLFYKTSSMDSFRQYQQPLNLKKTQTVEAFATLRSKKSKRNKARLKKNDNSIIIQSITAIAQPYDGGHEAALIDGIKAGTSFKSGLWQGFYNTDLTISLKLNKTKVIDSVSLGLLSNPRSWIWFPKSIKIMTSGDGKQFQEAGSYLVSTKRDNQKTQRKDFNVRINKHQEARYIKIIAKYPGKIPEWHPGAGKPCFIFADELKVY